MWATARREVVLRELGWREILRSSSAPCRSCRGMMMMTTARRKSPLTSSHVPLPPRTSRQHYAQIRSFWAMPMLRSAEAQEPVPVRRHVPSHGDVSADGNYVYLAMPPDINPPALPQGYIRPSPEQIAEMKRRASQSLAMKAMAGFADKDALKLLVYTGIPRPPLLEPNESAMSLSVVTKLIPFLFKDLREYGDDPYTLHIIANRQVVLNDWPKLTTGRWVQLTHSSPYPPPVDLQPSSESFDGNSAAGSLESDTSKTGNVSNEGSTVDSSDVQKKGQSESTDPSAGENRSSKTQDQPTPNEKQSRDSQQQKQQGPSFTPRGGVGNNNSNNQTGLIIMASFAILAFVINILLPGMSETTRTVTWQDVRKNYLEKGLVERFTVHDLHVQADIRDWPQPRKDDGNMGAESYGTGQHSRTPKRVQFRIGSVDSFERNLEAAQDELGIHPTERIPVVYSPAESAMMGFLRTYGVPLAIFTGILFINGKRMGGSGAMSFLKSRAKKFNKETAIKVKYSDVAGCDEAKLEIMEFVNFLKDPGRFERLGAKIPRGAILSGAPGTGKTLLAKATAGESNVPFYSVSGSEFVELFVGVGPGRVRDLFSMARKDAPCIIFIDEIDAIGQKRSERSISGGHDERESTLNQILTEMDGFNTTEKVVVIAGTNRPDVLDPALMRPGRFDRHINIDKPTMNGRVAIFKVHLAKIKTGQNAEDLTGRLAALTPGFSGADIANCVNEAALVAARANAETVERHHFEQAIERVIAGMERKSLVLSKSEKRTVAYHEAGHAICGWFFEFADPLLKVSIIPRGHGALGYAQYLPSGDSFLMTMNQLMDRMAMTLGGRVSEEIHFSSVTTGGSDDFQKVTQMARAMVTKFGMSSKLGPIHYDENPSHLNKPFAEDTARVIDNEVKSIVDEAYKKCRTLLESRKKEIELVAEELLKKEMLTRDDMIRLLGKRQWPDKEDVAKYLGDAGTGTIGGEHSVHCI